MADQAEAAEQAARSPLDQAAADGSITQARPRAVDPVPIVAEVVAVAGAGSATLEPVLETNEPDMGVKTSMNPEAPIVDGSGDGAVGGGTAVAPAAGARRRLSPRPVPVSRRRRAPAATDEERTPAEEMDDVGTQDDKAEAAAEAAKAGATPGTDAGAASSDAGGATATKTARPKTAAEIVAEQRAREKAAETPAAAAGSEDAAAGSPDAAAGDAEKPAPSAATGAAAASTGATGSTGAGGKPPVKPSGASGNKPPASKGASSGSSGKGKQALTSVGSGVRKLRNLIASLIWLIAVLAAAVLALGALFTALDQTNQSNEIVRWILERGHDLVGPFKDLFRLQTAKNTLLVNWGIAALVYLIAGKIVEKIIRP
ncbi:MULTISPECIES: hypothetical protein [Kribbella]|uniref:Uncharacterized protein n=1 Tax=Kribbella karoonensis TaxID=324851 RepID=A0ABN2D6C3_9ACTN